MKKILFFVLLSYTTFAQSVIQSNTSSIILTPNGVRTTYAAGYDSTNTSVGADALKFNVGKKYNTAFGASALKNNSTGTLGFHSTNNAAFGYGALTNNTQGYYNVAVGANALSRNTTGYNNVAIGDSALGKSLVNHSNVAIGFRALARTADPGVQQGNENTAVGTYAGAENTTGYWNTALGESTMFANTTGNSNTALGRVALNNNITGNDNTAVGTYSLFWGTNISRNSSLGRGALHYNQANDNTALGYRSMYENLTGVSNTALGNESLKLNESGNNNVSIGYQSGFSNVSGSGNVFLGYNAGYNVTGSDKLVIENSSAAESLIAGNFELDRVGINRQLGALESRTETFQVNGEAFKNSGTGNWVIPSDRRLKENIVYLSSQQMLDKVLKMKGVTYNWIDKSRGTDTVYGFIAQDLQQIFPENIKTDKEGFLSASYGAYDPMIIESIKALNQKIENLQTENLQLKTHNEKLLKRLDNIEARLNN